MLNNTYEQTSYLVDKKYLQGHLMQSPFRVANSKISLNYGRSMVEEVASRQGPPSNKP